ncbi:uncharacterized protein LOC131686982 [Topomyia yanbarensis]|uniref:uncharacterized protein LOC131686982 n=1 Tax=Topomyia yanbarensis TaxID=2498891 RepID=UPI00273CDB3F|nr:uncharacterized protein LOC131686982 [Topomyia yanbarensis]
MECHNHTSKTTTDDRIGEVPVAIFLKNVENATIPVGIGLELEDDGSKRCCTEISQLNILDLNDDCLELVFGRFKLEELITLAKTCTRFSAIAGNVVKRNKQYFSHWIYMPKPCYFSDFLKTFGYVLEHLTVSHCVEINLIAMHCTNLKELTVGHCSLNSLTFEPESLLGFESLERFSIIWSEISPYFIERLKKLRNLQRLDLSYSYFLTESLHNLTNLKHLNLRGTLVTDECFSCLARNNPDLEQLNISDCNQLSAKSIQCIAKYMTKLTYLSWSQWYLNEPYECSTDRQQIVESRLLKQLVIEDNNYGTGAIDYLLRSLAKFDQLEQLELKNQRIYDYGLICNLANLRIFKYLYNGSSVNDFEFAKLCAKENFIEVHISGRELSEEQLVKFIVKNRRLELLYVYNFSIRSMDFIISVLKTLKWQSNHQEIVRAGLQKRRLNIHVQDTYIPIDTIQNLLAESDHLLKLFFYRNKSSSWEQKYASYISHDNSSE